MAAAGKNGPQFSELEILTSFIEAYKPKIVLLQESTPVVHLNRGNRSFRICENQDFPANRLWQG